MTSEAPTDKSPLMLRVRTFGECTMQIGNRRFGPDAAIVFAILLVLIFERGERVTRDRLLRLLWPRTPSSREFQRLRQALYKARQTIQIPIEVTPTHVSLAREAVDADFADLIDPGWQGYCQTHPVPVGDFLPGYIPDFSLPFAEWVDTQREMIESRLRVSIITSMNEYRSAGNWSRVEEMARHCLARDPFHEEATLALAEAVASGGRDQDAIAVLDSYLTEVRDEPAGTSNKPAMVLRQRLAEKLHAEPYLRTSEGAFIGRSESMRLLQESTRRTLAGYSTATFVWGEPGMGKSRLVDEFCNGAAITGTVVRRIACLAVDTQRSLSVFADLVPHLRHLPGALGCSPESLHYLDILTLRAPAGEGTQGGDAADESQATASGIRRAILDLLDAAASESRLLVVVEDVHWADPASLGLLHEVLLWSESRQLQFVFTSRTPPTFQSSARDPLGSRLIVHRLPALNRDAAAELLRTYARDQGREADGEFVNWAVRVASGNPYYLRELLGRWLKTSELYSVPPTLASLLTSRVGAMEKDDLRLLQACAVLGRHGRPDRLQRLLEYGNREVIEALESLGTAGLVIVDGEHVECRHELIVDAALQHVSDATRQALFRLGADLLEQESGTSGEMSLLWDCARLWHMAGDVERAIESSISCASRLRDIGRPADAVELLDRARVFCSTAEHHLRVLTEAQRALYESGQHSRLAQCISEKASFAHSLGRRIRAHDDDELHVLDARWRATTDADDCLSSVLACVQTREASASHRVGAAVLGLIACDALCDVSRAHQIYEAVSSDIQHLPTLHLDSLFTQLIFHTSFGSLATAEHIAETIVDQAKPALSMASRCRALRNAASAFRRVGRHDRAISSLSEALELSESYQLRSGLVPSVEGLVQSYLDIDDLPSARRWFEHGQQIMESLEDAGTRVSMSFLQTELLVAEATFSPRDSAASAQLARFAESHLPRIRVNALALLVAIRVNNGEKVSATLLASLVQMHLITRARGGQDLAAYAVFRGLMAAGDETRAKTLLREYLTIFRRDRGKPPARLTPGH